MNEPCWCGSGLKYKRCHRVADETLGATPAEIPGLPGADVPGAAATSVAPAPAPRGAAGPVRAGRVSPRREVPAHIARPDYAQTGRPGPGVRGDPATRLERMRRAARAAAEVLREVSEKVRPGVTTDELDAAAHAACLARGAYPSPLGYRGFPKSICTSVNEVVLHGIPDSRPLGEGDLVGLDVTLYLDGMHGDCAATVPAGETDEAGRRLLEAGRACLRAGIAAVRPGRPTRDVGRAIERVARDRGVGIVREYCGHGIGEVFHTDLYVPHWDDPAATRVLRAGDLLTVEPMVTAGSPRTRVWADGWTVATSDGSRSAHFEHTVRVTEDGAEVLTEPGPADPR